jgi:hypothetical protein
MQSSWKGRAVCVAFATAVLNIAASVPASAHYRVLYNFCSNSNCADGWAPNGIVEDQQGNLYGTTNFGGENNCEDGCGVVFELKKKSRTYVYTELYRFTDGEDGAYPGGSLVVDTSGNLYGTTEEGGGFNWGNVFELAHQNKAWNIEVLYSFCAARNCTDGAEPRAGLTYAGQQSGELYDGIFTLFGTASVGALQGGGVAFGLQPQSGSWNYHVIYDFCSKANCADGGTPEAPLIEDVSGNLYGTTMTYGGGMFELAPVSGGWSETVLHAFCSEKNCSDGDTPYDDGLAMDSSGYLYGMTNEGGHVPCSGSKYGCGVAYKLAWNGSSWQQTVLHAFCGPKKADCGDGVQPLDTPVLDAYGNVFGTAQRGGGPTEIGTPFELSGSKLQVLHRFCKETGCTDGAHPSGNLVLSAGGAIFGTTLTGGTKGGGVVYEYVP